MKRFLVAMMITVVGLGVGACSKKDDPAAKAAAGGKGKAGGRGARGGGGLSFPVDMLTVEVKKNEYLIKAPGTLEAFERVQVTARVSGVVDRVAFREGQEVKKGDVLVSIDGERYRLSVNTAKAGLDKANASQLDVEAQVRRREGASEKNPGLIPGEELETFRTKSLTAKADTAVSQENLRAAQLNLRDSGVRAPMSGTIQTRTVETGQYVQAGYVMATLLQRDPMLLRFQVLPSDAPRIKVGQEVTFTLRETLRAFTAKVTLVSGAADADTRLVPITAQVDSTDHKFWLRPGAFADVSINLPSTRESPIIPRAAIRPSDRGFLVFVIEGDVAKERVLTLGMNTANGWVEVRDGLKGGEKLVVRGQDSLKEGTKVTARLLTSFDEGPASEPSGPPTAASAAALAERASDPSDGAAPEGSGSPASSAAPAGSAGRKRREGGLKP
jgi:RND family efflux transporter MFP subunit